MGGPIDGTLGWTFLAYYKSVALSAGHNNNVFSCATGKLFEMAANSNVAFNGYDQNGFLGFDQSPVPLQRKTWNVAATLGWHMQIVTLVPPKASNGAVLGQVDGVAMTPGITPPAAFTGWDCALEGDFNVGNNTGSNSDLEGCLYTVIVWNVAYTGGTLAGLRNFIRLHAG
jgi:hypothetical protein